MTAHALLSPSSSDRWLNCPASAAIAARHPDTSSAAADEGTAAHTLAAWCLTEDINAAAYVGRIIAVAGREEGAEPRRFTVDDEMADYVQAYVDRCREATEFAGAVGYVEQSLQISSITGERGATGTSDYCAVVPAGLHNDLVVRDLKFGRGVLVGAEGNTQLLMYAAAALEWLSLAYDFDDDSIVHMWIDQPRRGNVDCWALSVAEMRVEIAKVREGAEVALSAGVDGPRAAGDWCRFCPIAATCKTRSDWVAGQMTDGFVLESATVPTETDDGLLTRSYARVAAIRDWCASVEREMAARLNRGVDMPGHKLVLGKLGDRAWADETAALTTLISHGAKREDLFVPEKLKSPAQAEKLIPAKARKLLAPLTKRSDGKPTIAPKSDPRPGLNVSPIEGLPNLVDDDEYL